MIDLSQIKTGAYSTIETLKSTHDLTKYVLDNNIKGDLVECGVGAGSQVAVMKNSSINRKIWLFDSFQGIPMASMNDDQQPGVKWFDGTEKLPKKSKLVSSGITSHSIENVKNNLNKWCGSIDNMVFVEGWFQNTLPKTEIGDISLLRLDGDLYDSTKVCLEYLFPKLVSGGVLIIDDWALPGCQKACIEYFENNKVGIAHKVHKSTPVWFLKK